MILDLQFEIFDLNGKKVEEKTTSFLADMVMSHTGDKLKLYELALKINKSATIEVDLADLKLIEAAVNENQRYPNLICGAILKEIEQQKALASKKDKT